MIQNKLKKALIAFTVIGVLIFGSVGVTAQTNAVPFEQTGISEDADNIEYVIDGNATYPSSSVVTLNVEVTGTNVSETGNTTDILLTDTVNVAEGSSVIGNYNVTETDRSNYDRYAVNVTGDTSTTPVENIDSVNVNVMTLSSGGGGVFAGDGLLSGSIMGVPTVLVVLALAVGAFILYNDNDEFD